MKASLDSFILTLFLFPLLISITSISSFSIPRASSPMLLSTSSRSPLLITSRLRRSLSSSPLSLNPSPFLSYLFPNTPPPSPLLITAPMVSQSDYAFREVTRLHGASITYTQMLHARNFVASKKYRSDNLDFDCNVEGRGNGKPVFVQIAGDDVEVLTAAAVILQDDYNVDAICLNLGCPQKIAKKGNYGAYLLSQLSLVCTILTSLKQAVRVPIVCKIRVFEDVESSVALAKCLEATGISLLTVHGRTITENKTATKQVNWKTIKAISDALSIPVVSNGGIEYHSDIEKCVVETGVVGVMSSEGILENPAIFSKQYKDDIHLTPRSLSFRQINLARQYLTCATTHPPVGGTGGTGGQSTVRSHIFKILYRLLDKPSMHDLRNKLSEFHSNSEFHVGGVIDEIEDRIRGMSDEKVHFDVEGFSWYKRHRQIENVNVKENVGEEILGVEERKILMRERLEKMRVDKAIKQERERGRVMGV